MSWISPTFDEGGFSDPPPNKKTKTKELLKTEHYDAVETTTTSCNWLQKYKPSTIDDLAVNVKKTKEIEAWLEQSVLTNSSSKFLLLTGPSGCGKTAALQTVCKRLGFKILEWITPLDKPGDDSEYPSRFEFSKSAAKQFEEYLFRSSRYGSCLSLTSTKKLVLVKDFPNTFLHNPTTFHEILESFFEKCKYPVVFIYGDESHCKRLFTTSLKTNCQIHTITLNSIPDQRMFKVLKNIHTMESKMNKDIKSLSDDALHAICSLCQGDLRSAISKLYFCSINSAYDINQLKTKRRPKKNKSIGEMSEIDKDQRLDFFHGVGRVLYPKKIDSDKGLKFVHSTEIIVENFLSEPNAFMSQLHENYPSKLGNVYDLRDAAERLSKSDILMTRWQDKDIFQTYSLSVAVQGLMVSNRNPQKAKFEAFRKSQTSRMDVDCKAIELEGKAIFSNLCILDYECLIDILPYSRFLLADLDAGQLEYVRKTCQFKSI